MEVLNIKTPDAIDETICGLIPTKQLKTTAAFESVKSKITRNENSECHEKYQFLVTVHFPQSHFRFKPRRLRPSFSVLNSVTSHKLQILMNTGPE